MCLSVCVNNMLKKLAICVIVFYQRYLSPFKVTSCRFYPSCSHYSLLSLEKYGFVKGLWYALLRILKCHPFHAGGYDPVK
jgi:putative membrane protein insertion efficiency factor